MPDNFKKEENGVNIGNADSPKKDIYFTNRESAVLFGIPSNFIEGILVGREYEEKPEILSRIKELLPNAYICNLSGKVIVE